MLLHITEIITIPSAWLNHKLKQYILDDLKKRKKHTYSKTHGYIKDVIRLEKIHNAYVAFADSSNRFTIEYVIDVIKPSSGVKCTGKIIGIYDQGIFINADGFQALVVVDKDQLNIKHKKTKLQCGCPEMTIGDSIDMVIQDVEFKGNQLSCVGIHTH